VLLEGNEGLQQRVRQVLDLRNKGRTVVTGGLSQLEGVDTRYRCGQPQKQQHEPGHECSVSVNVSVQVRGPTASLPLGLCANQLSASALMAADGE
jgi:hypothetical protein